MVTSSSPQSFSHPIVSTFLWLFGDKSKEEVRSDNNTIETTQTGRHKINWPKDGKELATVFTNDKSSISRTSRYQKNRNVADGADEMIFQDDIADDNNSEPSESPQWGFYVNISPNHDATYPKLKNHQQSPHRGTK